MTIAVVKATQNVVQFKANYFIVLFSKDFLFKLCIKISPL